MYIDIFLYLYLFTLWPSAFNSGRSLISVWTLAESTRAECGSAKRLSCGSSRQS